MAIAVSDIGVGRYFVTSTGEIRRVAKMDGRLVIYQTRSNAHDGDTQGLHTMVGAEQFASEAQTEVMLGLEPKADQSPHHRQSARVD